MLVVERRSDHIHFFYALRTPAYAPITDRGTAGSSPDATPEIVGHLRQQRGSPVHHDSVANQVVQPPVCPPAVHS